MSLHKAHSHGRRRCSAWLLAGLLVLIAQTVSAIHELDPQNQSPEHVCEICVAGASLDAANVGALELALAPAPAADRFVHTDGHSTRQSNHLPPSRGPPATS